MKLKYIFFSALTAAASLFLASCEDHTFSEFGDADLGDEVTVTFTVSPEAAATASRAENDDDDNDNPVVKPVTIGDGSKCDVLIYAVYDDDGNLLEQYGRGVDPELAALGFKVHDTQSAFYIKDGFPATVNITFKRGTKYHVAFWAQSTKCSAYNTTDLKKVEIIYGEVPDEETDGDDTPGDVQDTPEGTGPSRFRTTTPNNDEYRDAFCRSVEVQPTATSNVMQQNVYLYRPLAQINVGTVGYDYEIVTRDAVRKYAYSKIRINRVARYLDVVTDRVYNSTTDEEHSFTGEKTPEAFAVVDFGYAPIPAYANHNSPNTDRDEWLPNYPSFTIHDWLYDSAFEYKKPHDDLDREQYEDEQFLRVKHIKDDSRGDLPTDADGFVMYANYNNRRDAPTETYKYLSMCYVLTSSTKDDPITINNIKVWLATDAEGSNEIEILNVNHVPAQRNWRTNIVGTLLTEENNYNISLDRDFAGDYNAWANGDEWEWSGPLAEGVYYNAAKDQIEISSAEGLIWFQRMVNGDLTIRENALDKHIGEYYHYGDGDKQLRIDGIKKPSDPVLMKRILRATHQDVNKAQFGNLDDQVDHWPNGNRFHFCGQDPVNTSFDDPAKVVLMADIDLGGIEWIPIGFESKINEQQGYTFDGSYSKSCTQSNGINRGYYCVKNSNPTVRGFYGIFDGNNHTISNLTTKRMGVQIQEWDQERIPKYTSKHTGVTFDDNFHYNDNPQWFARGLFGQIFLNAKIRNVRLVNVDIKGCHGVGGIVGAAYGYNIEITNCHVDGGSIVVTPLYRGDLTDGTKTVKDPTTGQDVQVGRNRTFARGVFLGGIVGYFNTREQTLTKADKTTKVYFPGGKVEDCSVNNVYLQGYRRLGALVGSVDLPENHNANANNTNAFNKAYPSKPASFKNNSISNVVFVASTYSTFGMKCEYSDGMYKYGFGYDGSQYSLFAQPFVGGDDIDYKDKFPALFEGTYASGLTFAELVIDLANDTGSKRTSTIATVPLKHMPILSTWFVDEVILNDNFYGEAVAKKVYRTSLFWPRSLEKSAVFHYPMSLPINVEIDWASASNNSNVGIYVDGIKLKGNGIGHRSVITPDNVKTPGSAVMFVTSRNTKEFWEDLKKENDTEWYKKEIEIRDVVLRGSPYAYTGMLLSPNENVKSIYLNNVNIYDCFQTIALDDYFIADRSTSTFWPNKAPSPAGIPLIAEDCNFRGYTVPGKGWKSITYRETTFEAGTNTGNSTRLERTCKVESPTDFFKCAFKAPYYIDLTAIDDLDDVKFVHYNSNGTVDESVKNVATSTTKNNITISLQGRDGKGDSPKCAYIEITSDSQGNPIVTYKDAEGNKIL